MSQDDVFWLRNDLKTCLTRNVYYYYYFPKQSLAVGVLTVLLRGLAGSNALVAAAADHFLL